MDKFLKLLQIGNEFKLKADSKCEWCHEIIEGDFVETFNELADTRGFNEDQTRELYHSEPCYWQAVSEWQPRNIEALKKKAEEKYQILLEKKRAILLNEGMEHKDNIFFS